MTQVPMLKNSSTSPTPRALAMRPPTMAPTMPISIVTMMPPGSSPGMMALAMAPAISPSTIHPMNPIELLRVTAATSSVGLAASALPGVRGF